MLLSKHHLSSFLFEMGSLTGLGLSKCTTLTSKTQWSASAVMVKQVHAIIPVFLLIPVLGIKLRSNFPLDSRSQTSKCILHFKFYEFLLSLVYMLQFSENMNEEVYVCISCIELILNKENILRGSNDYQHLK